MMFSPGAAPSPTDAHGFTRSMREADRARDRARVDRVEKMKDDGMLMSFSPPKKSDRIKADVKAEATRKKKNVFTMSFTPGGTLQSDGLDMDTTPEELRRMREVSASESRSDEQ